MERASKLAKWLKKKIFSHKEMKSYLDGDWTDRQTAACNALFSQQHREP